MKCETGQPYCNNEGKIEGYCEKCHSMKGGPFLHFVTDTVIPSVNENIDNNKFLIEVNKWVEKAKGQPMTNLREYAFILIEHEIGDILKSERGCEQE